MGSQSKRRKGTKDQRNTIQDMRREADQDALRVALSPEFEGKDQASPILSAVSYIEVTETLGSETTGLPGRLAVPKIYKYNITGPPAGATLILQLEGNYSDTSGNSNTVTPGSGNVNG